MAVNSWDLFDTLIASRSGNRAGEVESGDWVPIAENIGRVQPDDIIVSDYYADQIPKAERALRFTGLKNKLIVTDGGKRDGYIWPTLGPIARHHGDNAHSDVQMPRRYGIESEHIVTAELTSAERRIANHGLPTLALACREARLSTYHSTLRQMQILQISYNFPVLFLAAVALDVFAKVHKANIVLMSARDCCLWTSLQENIRFRQKGEYEIEYIPSSRFCRNSPSIKYLTEINQRLDQGAVIADIGGTGKSLARLIARSSQPQTKSMLIAKYPWVDLDGYPAISTENVGALGGIADNIMEDVNVPAEGIHLDWDVQDNQNFDWNCEEIRTAHRAFERVRIAMWAQPLPDVINQGQLIDLYHQIRPAVGQSLDFLKSAIEYENELRRKVGAGF